jgi:hypothetical protein
MGYIADRTTIAVDEIFKRMKVDTDPLYTPRFRKFIRWFGYSAIPFIFTVATFIVMVWLFNRIYGGIGFERTIIVLLVLLWLKEKK